MSILDAIGSLFVGIGESAVGNAAERLDALRKKRQPNRHAVTETHPKSQTSSIGRVIGSAASVMTRVVPGARETKWRMLPESLAVEFRVRRVCGHVTRFEVDERVMLAETTPLNAIWPAMKQAAWCFCVQRQQ